MGDLPGSPGHGLRSFPAGAVPVRVGLLAFVEADESIGWVTRNEGHCHSVWVESVIRINERA